MTQTPKWYVVHTYSGYESKVKKNLENATQNKHLGAFIKDVKVPIETVEEIKDGKTKEVERKIYPSYVIVKMIMNDESWYIVRNIRGVTGFVGPGSKPVPLTPGEVEALGVEEKKVEVDYAKGDAVKVSSGSLEGFDGVVKSVDLKNNKVLIEITILGRQTEVELDLNQVIKSEQD